MTEPWHITSPYPTGQEPPPAPQPTANDIIVGGPDGATIRFPAGTDEATIRRVMQQRYPAPQTPTAPGAPGDTHVQRPLPGQSEGNRAAQDVLPSFGTGIAQGAYELATLPATALRGAAGLSNWIAEDWFGLDPLFPDNGLMQPVFDLQDQGREWMADTFHQPTTTAGEFARTIGEFVPGAAALGPGNLFGNTVRYGVIPGVASETAGQLFNDTELEPFARAAAGILAGGAMALQANAGAGAGLPGTAGAAASVLANSLRNSGLTPAQMAQAERLIADGASRGVTLTWPEALYTVTGGRVDATMLQRFVEQSRGGQPIMSQVMGGRAATTTAAAAREIPNVGPAATPAALGQLTQELADDAIRYVRDQINATTRPLYNAAGPTQVDPIAFGQLYNDPLVQQAIRNIRNDPVYSRTVAGLPDDSVAMMDALKKYFDDMAGRQAGERANFAASVYGQQSNAARDAAANASPEYAQALAEQSMLRRQWLDPLERGQMGALAGTDDLGTQTSTLFPRNPFAGTAQETADTVSTLAAQSPDAAAALVRAHIEQVFDQATRELVRGGNQFGAARFVAELRGNSQQAATLEAAVRALPNGDARWEGLEALMRVFQATGSRLPANSATTFNTAIEAQMTRGTPLASLGSLLTSPGSAATAVQRWYADFRLGRNSAELARIITDPASAPLLQRLAMGGRFDDLISVAATLINQSAGTIGGEHFDNPRLGALIPPAPAPVANVNGY